MRVSIFLQHNPELEPIHSIIGFAYAAKCGSLANVSQRQLRVLLNGCVPERYGFIVFPNLVVDICDVSNSIGSEVPFKQCLDQDIGTDLSDILSKAMREQQTNLLCRPSTLNYS